jgi:TonB family protein
MNIRLMSACSLAAALSVSALNPLSAAVLDAKPISQPAPSYSHDLRVACVEGEVVVSFTITARGDVINPEVVKSTDRALDASVLKAVRQWKFEPATQNGVAINEKALQSIAFVIPELHSASEARLIVANTRPASGAKDSTSTD